MNDPILKVLLGMKQRFERPGTWCGYDRDKRGKHPSSIDSAGVSVTPGNCYAVAWSLYGASVMEHPEHRHSVAIYKLLVRADGQPEPEYGFHEVDAINFRPGETKAGILGLINRAIMLHETRQKKKRTNQMSEPTQTQTEYEYNQGYKSGYADGVDYCRKLVAEGRECILKVNDPKMAWSLAEAALAEAMKEEKENP